MPSPILQILLLPFAGAGLWWCWRWTTRDRLLSLTIAAGLLVRAVLGQILFWTSYLGLPAGRSLQLGNGFWFFGVDGILYFTPAARAALEGLVAIAAISDTQPSVFFIRVLGVFAWLFGPVPSVAILLNLFAYLGTAALMVRWGSAAAVPRATIAIPLAFISFAPAWILWSMQPLKDSLFCFLIVLFGVLVDRWLRSWPTDLAARTPIVGIVLASLAIAAAMYAIAGVRWYYGFIALGALGFASPYIFLRRGSIAQNSARVLTLVMILLVTTQAIIWGAGPYLPEKIHKILRPPMGALTQAPSPTRQVAEVVGESRAKIDAYDSAGTRIKAGELIADDENESAPDLRRANPAGADLPQTIADRLVAGFAALLLPRFVASKIGLISVGGGRGLWIFAEIDTILFDAFLIVAIWLIARGLRSGAWRDPFVWYLLIVTIAIATVLAYTISNFGTLFRHREMVVASLVLLVLAASRVRDPSVPESDARF